MFLFTPGFKGDKHGDEPPESSGSPSARPARPSAGAPPSPQAPADDHPETPEIQIEVCSALVRALGQEKAVPVALALQQQGLGELHALQQLTDSETKEIRELTGLSIGEMSKVKFCLAEEVRMLECKAIEGANIMTCGIQPTCGLPSPLRGNSMSCGIPALAVPPLLSQLFKPSEAAEEEAKGKQGSPWGWLKTARDKAWGGRNENETTSSATSDSSEARTSPPARSLSDEMAAHTATCAELHKPSSDASSEAPTEEMQDGVSDISSAFESKEGCGSAHDGGTPVASEKQVKRKVLLAIGGAPIITD